jgi:hypothetical protein
MNNNLGPTGTLTQHATLIPTGPTGPTATLPKMDPLNQQPLRVLLTEGTNKHMATHETPVQTLTYLELREWYG